MEYSYPIGPNTLEEEVREQILDRGYAKVEVTPGQWVTIDYRNKP